jgi:hydroxymethylpyrimidine/phosphomethylpyrimidine kinase
VDSGVSRPVVLSIGTTHPWNTAGLGLDLSLEHELNVEIFTVVTAVSAQDAGGIRRLTTIDEQTVRAQIESLPFERVRAMRVGALTSAQNVRVVAGVVRAHAIPVVVDPVFGATHGGRFADGATIAAIRDELATLGNVVLTPNLAEAAELLASTAIERETLAGAAHALHRLGALAVLLKGGHLDGDPADALATGGGVEIFSEPRVSGEMRGTGCTLAIALASRLAQGADLRDAVIDARAFVRSKIGSLAAH